MVRPNQEIRDKLRIRNIPQWRLAVEIGVSENTVCRWLRMPLSADKEARLLSALDQLTDGKG